MTYNINKQLLLYLSLTFFVTTIIGTVSHECAHYLAAKTMGFKAHIGYAMTQLKDSGKFMTNREWLFFVLAGPLQTMATGTIGLLLLFKLWKASENLSKRLWLLVFLSLFWLRQPANFVLGIITLLISGRFPDNSDEVNLSRFFQLPELLLVSITAFLGIAILVIVIFKFIPKSQRFTFILSGLFGGITGYLFWIVLFGQKIMP